MAVHNSGVRAYVGVTDGSWYRFLADRPGVTEVNFWQPSGAREFRVLAPGEPFFFARNIVQGKSYDMADPAVAGYFADVLQLTLGAAVELDFGQPWHRSGAVFGDPRLAPYRLGQQSFKAVVLDSYRRRCAISGTHIPPVLQAAHIRPVARAGSTGSTTGCCSGPISTLFDRGYLGVDPQHRLLVSPRLRAEFSNGDQFYAKAGQIIDLPTRRTDRPGREYLEWHLDEVFLKAGGT